MIKSKYENLIVTYCYPGCGKYLEEFIKSINNQINKNFTTVFFCNNYKIKKNYLYNISTEYLQVNLKGSASSVRANSLKKILNLKSKKIIFADIDDTMDIRRSKIILKLLDKNSIVLNDLDLNYVWLKKKRLNYLSNFLKNNQKISYKNLIESNMMGMTNTAMTIKTLKKSIKFLHSAKKAKVFDWYYWSKSLQSNYAIFTNKTSTKYNIFHNSKNKIPPDEDFKSIKNLLRVKENFYYLMADDKKIYKTKFLEYRNFLKYIKLNNLKNINNLLDYKRNLWWSINIKYEY